MIAIVIPYYNYLFFEQTLESLANQTDKRFNVYIGDDCSPSDPHEILSKFKSLLQITYFRYDKNLGHTSLAQHWNRCVSLIKSESWILILGDDDKLSTDTVANFYKNIDEVIALSLSLIRLSSILIDENNNFTSKVYKHEKEELAKDSLLRKLKSETRSSLTEYIFSKKVFDKFQFKHYPLAWHSDDMAWIDFSENKPIYTINDSIAYIRFTKNSISGKKENRELKVEANHIFLNYLLKANLNYTKSEFNFLMDRFVLFLKLNKKFNLKSIKFLILATIQRKRPERVFFIFNEYIRYKVNNFKKKIKGLLKVNKDGKI